MGELALAERWHALATSLDPTVDQDVYRFYLAGDRDGALAMAQELFQSEPDLWQRQIDYGMALMVSGRNKEALKNLERGNEMMRSQSLSDQLTYYEVSITAWMAWLRKTQGQDIRAKAQIDELRSGIDWAVSSGLPPGFQAHLEAHIAAVMGDVDETITQSGRQLDLGLELFQQLYSPIFAEMRDHPDGIALLERYEAQQSAKLAKLKETADPILFDPPATVEGFL